MDTEIRQILKTDLAPGGLLDCELEEGGSFYDAIMECERVAKMAKTSQGRICIYIGGESGTGKTHIAEQVVHALLRLGGAHGDRKGFGFKAINVAALQGELFLSELFGHVRGAFTGATKDKIGLVETVSGGTVFLDEIAKVPPGDQGKLLEFIQTGVFRRVGDTVARSSDASLVMASREDLGEELREGRIIEDFYNRVTGTTINLPPLRSRVIGHMPWIVRTFWEKKKESSREFMPWLYGELLGETLRQGKYEWPGNYRELEQEVLKFRVDYDRNKPIPAYSEFFRRMSRKMDTDAREALLIREDQSTGIRDPWWFEESERESLFREWKDGWVEEKDDEKEPDFREAMLKAAARARRSDTGWWDGDEEVAVERRWSQALRDFIVLTASDSDYTSIREEIAKRTGLALSTVSKRWKENPY